MIEIDHIDPRWEVGRDYQLICGLSTPDNLTERNPAVNTKKSNRFLPYRGTAPVNEGDYTYFLSNDNEWVYEAFMGEWWYNETRNLCGPGQPATDTQKKAASLAQKGRKFKQSSRKLMSQSHTGMKKPWVTNQHLNGKLTECKTCGKMFNVGNLAKHIKSRRNQCI